MWDSKRECENKDQMKYLENQILTNFIFFNRKKGDEIKYNWKVYTYDNDWNLTTVIKTFTVPWYSKLRKYFQKTYAVFTKWFWSKYVWQKNLWVIIWTNYSSNDKYWLNNE